MLVKTKHFGEVELDDDKVLTFNSGIFGFEECKRFTILYNNEKGDRPSISWLQSLDMEELALPVVSPSLVMDSYDPIVNDDVLDSLGKLTEENLDILLTLTVPYDLTKMTTNLKAPIIINSDTKYGCQIVAENEDYVIKYPVYDKFNDNMEKKGEM
jgi:flagellar assembly factor FliW